MDNLLCQVYDVRLNHLGHKSFVTTATPGSDRCSSLVVKTDYSVGHKLRDRAVRFAVHDSFSRWRVGGEFVSFYRIWSHILPVQHN
jgi:hypothetical protein